MQAELFVRRGPGRRRFSTKRSDPKDTEAPLEGTPLHRKQACVKALTKRGADRATAAYNELGSRHSDLLVPGYDKHKADIDSLGAFLTRLCAHSLCARGCAPSTC